MTADALGIRMAHLEGAYEQIDKRLGSLEGQIQGLQATVNDLRNHVDGSINGLRNHVDLGQ
jgi:hypothetical protein